MASSPTEQLRDEHELVLIVVEAMQREVAGIERTGRVHRERVAQMVDFARGFTDGCHHAKEETLLFPALEARSAAAAPVSVMLNEHAAGRDAIRAIEVALPDADTSAGARAAVVENLALYVRLLRSHIGKENAVLFPLAERILSVQEQEMLARDFERVEAAPPGAAAHKRYHEMAHTLATPPADG